MITTESGHHVHTAADGFGDTTRLIADRSTMPDQTADW